MANWFSKLFFGKRQAPARSPGKNYQDLLYNGNYGAKDYEKSSDEFEEF